MDEGEKMSEELKSPRYMVFDIEKNEIICMTNYIENIEAEFRTMRYESFLRRICDEVRKLEILDAGKLKEVLNENSRDTEETETEPEIIEKAYWKKGEIEKLLADYKEKTIPEIAKELNRDEEAVKKKIITLKNEGKL